MFSTPWLVFWDGLRLLVAVLALGVVALTPKAVTRPHMHWHQRVRFAGLAMISVAIIGGYLAQLGELPSSTWRTAVVMAGIAASFVGTLGFHLQYWRYDHDGRNPGRHGR